jgi:hypothetical protein
MLAYLFWHVPRAGVDPRDYESALVGFHADLGASPPPGLEGSATYRTSELPWLDGRAGYEDWCFVASSAALDTLNQAAVKPERWNVHAAVSSRTEFGHGGLYYHLHGDPKPVAGSRVLWLKRPRGIRYEQPLGAMIGAAKGVLSCWRKMMVLGPGDEFAIVGDASLDVPLPEGWQGRMVERTLLGP